ncbi:MAG: hypothetical protein JWP64_1016 [Pseudonocardia sp.]|uniref:hypothetical protein n=1 Tax=Pseudonocardia sp. TaxID=60912 RepID=UPI00262B4E57|nr:hypothetical protein [Pseudonocardia sp.]MCU1626067.1 hypothetical protein [Pseudonocardia sp.]MDT7702111.1 hypothetical protein [Pseudonocardiales bacterium]HEV7470864.1 hypothetical protein [Pseudonocardia sp.]
MIREAELFVMAEQVLVEVIGRIRHEHWRIVVPAMFDMPGADLALRMKPLVNHYAYDDSWVPDLLAGRTMEDVGKDRFDGDLLGSDAAAAVARISGPACAAAAEVTDGDAIVHCSFGDVAARDYFWQLNIARCFLAHDVAMHLGSRACPLTEELARGMWEGTAPQAEAWRSIGIFREPIEPVPADVSWRDRFLMMAGRDPHPLVEHWPSRSR